MYEMFCTLSSCRWDIQRHCPVAIKLFVNNDVILLESDSDKINLKVKTHLGSKITSGKLRSIAAIRYGRKLDGDVSKVEFIFLGSRVYFHIKE